MEKAIQLSNGMEFQVIELLRNTNGNEEKIRLFIPNWNQIVYSPNFLEEIRKVYKEDKVKPVDVGLLVDYYILNTTPQKDLKITPNPQNRYARLFDPRIILHNYTFNEDLKKNNVSTIKEIKNFVASLSEKAQYNKYRSIKRYAADKYIDPETPLKTLIEDAFKLEVPENPFFTDQDFMNFTNDQIAKTFLINLRFAQKSSPKDITEADYKFIHHLFSASELSSKLISDEVIEKIKERVLEKVNEYKSIQQKIVLGSCNLDDFEKFLTSFKNDLDQIFDDFLIRLDEMIRYSRKDDLRNNLSKLKNIFDGYQSASNDKKIGLLAVLFNILADYKAAKSRLLSSIEPIFKATLRISTKGALKQLISEYNLSKAEIRLFIMHNIGVKKMGYATPLIETPISQFFKYNKHLANIFIDVVLNKNKTLAGQDAAWYLEMEFRGFLKFYKIYSEILKLDDNYNKNEYRYNSRAESLSDLQVEELNASFRIPTLNEDEPQEDKDENEGTSINEDEPQEDKDENEGTSIDIDGTAESDDIIETKKEINVQGKAVSNAALLAYEFPKCFRDLITKDVIRGHCNEKETDIIWRVTCGKETEEDVAKDYQVSRSMINKIKTQGLKKLRNSKMFKDTFPLPRNPIRLKKHKRNK